MKSSVIVKGNPVHDLVLGLAPRAEAHAVKPFDLQRSEQRFGDRIVPTIALAAHRAFHFEVPQELAVVVAGVLGGFNRSSQHPNKGGCDGHSEAAVVPPKSKVSERRLPVQFAPNWR